MVKAARSRAVDRLAPAGPPRAEERRLPAESPVAAAPLSVGLPPPEEHADDSTATKGTNNGNEVLRTTNLLPVVAVEQEPTEWFMKRPTSPVPADQYTYFGLLAV